MRWREWLEIAGMVLGLLGVAAGVLVLLGVALLARLGPVLMLAGVLVLALWVFTTGEWPW